MEGSHHRDSLFSLALKKARETEGEIVEEMARSLSRTGRRIEECLSRLRDLQGEISSALQRGQRERANLLLAEFQEVRQRAERYLYFLKIQREAVGFRIHPDFREFYPIPTIGQSHEVREDSHP